MSQDEARQRQHGVAGSDAENLDAARTSAGVRTAINGSDPLAEAQPGLVAEAPNGTGPDEDLADAESASDAAVSADEHLGDKKKDKVYEAGGIIICDDKVVLRFTDGGNWIFPKGKLKKHESPEDAAVREAVEETGLKVQVVGEAGGFRMKQHGKQRRFQFYLMRAVGKTWDWPHHEGRDTFLMPFERVEAMLRREGYGELWAQVRDRVRGLLDPASGQAVAGQAENRQTQPKSAPG